MSSTNSPIIHVPIGTPMFNTKSDSPQPLNAIADQEGGLANTANLTRAWILFFEQIQTQFPGPIIGFIINDGSTGTDVGPVLPAPYSGTVNVVTVAVKSSDSGTPLTFQILQNGINIFETDPTVAEGAATFSIFEFDDLTQQPLPVTENDLFTINITSGSSEWQFTAAVQTSALSSTGT